MFKIIKKIIFVVILVRILGILANVTPGPAKTIAILGIVVLGVREVFSKNADIGDE